MSDITQKAKKIKFLLTDVDGVLTNGKLNFFPMEDGRIEEFKCFAATDGLAARLAALGGLETGMITGRAHAVTVKRARSIGMKYIYQGFLKKMDAFKDFLSRENISPEEAAFIGDDVIDIGIMKACAFSVAPADAGAEAKACASYVSKLNGGEGVFRETVEIILRAQGKWDALVADIEKNGVTIIKKPDTVVVTSEEVRW